MKGRGLYRKKKKVYGIFLMIAALIIMQSPVAEADAATSASDFKMEGNTLVKYRGTEKNVTVPNTVEVIGESAFEGDTNIELVVLPNSVKRIDPYAFWGCNNLETVVLGKGLQEVGDYAFANCKGLDRMTVAGKVRSIGIQAFADCINMKDITIGPDVTSIHETAFDGCYRLTIHADVGSVADKYAQDFYERQKEMPEYEDVPGYRPDNGNITDGQTDTPGNNGMNGTGNEDSGVNDNTNNGGNAGDSGNLLGSTYVVGNQAVVLISSKSPTVLTGQVQEQQPAAEISPQKEVSPAEVSQEAASVNPPKYTIVDGRIVADQAYYRNQSLEHAALPDGIEEIGQFAFARSHVKQVVIPEGVENICYGAFYHCGELTEIALPETVSLVEPKAFSYSAWVEDFLDKGDSDFLISGGVLVAYRGTSANVEIPEGVRVIAGEAFLQHGEIESVAFPDSLVSIGEGAFEDCGRLANVSFSEAPVVSDIKDRAFAGCAISEVTLPDSVERLGIGAFEEAVKVEYAGHIRPERTYEISAQRLSNEDYREAAKGDGIGESTAAEPGVTVLGIRDALADLEGAAGAYTLSVQSVSRGASANGEAYDTLQRAYERSFGTSLPENTVVYDLSLYDDSRIPLTKLGKQKLTVTLPVSDKLVGKELQLYTTDRNGQLEAVRAEKIVVNDIECVRFEMSQVAPVGICSL